MGARGAPGGGGVKAALVLLGALLASAAQAGVADIVWDAQNRFAHEAHVEPGKFAEVCGKVTRGQSIAWRYTADKPMDFNIHYHVGITVVYLARKTAATARSKLRVTSNEDHCWMWVNKSDEPAALSLTLQR
jgi:hypothetical protein